MRVPGRPRGTSTVVEACGPSVASNYSHGLQSSFNASIIGVVAPQVKPTPPNCNPTAGPCVQIRDSRCLGGGRKHGFFRLCREFPPCAVSCRVCSPSLRSLCLPGFRHVNGTRPRIGLTRPRAATRRCQTVNPCVTPIPPRDTRDARDIPYFVFNSLFHLFLPLISVTRAIGKQNRVCCVHCVYCVCSGSRIPRPR